MIITFDNILINLLEIEPDITIQGKNCFNVFIIERNNKCYNHIPDEFLNYYVISGSVSTDEFFNLYNLCCDLKILGVKSKLLLKTMEDHLIYIDLVFNKMNKIIIETFNRYSYDIEYNYCTKIEKNVKEIKNNIVKINEYIIHIGIEISYEVDNEYLLFNIYPYSIILEGELITKDLIKLINEYLTLINIKDLVKENISFYIYDDKNINYTLFLEFCNKLNINYKMKVIFNTKILFKK